MSFSFLRLFFASLDLFLTNSRQNILRVRELGSYTFQDVGKGGLSLRGVAVTTKTAMTAKTAKTIKIVTVALYPGILDFVGQAKGLSKEGKALSRTAKTAKTVCSPYRGVQSPYGAIGSLDGGIRSPYGPLLIVWRRPRQMGRLRPFLAKFPNFEAFFCKTQTQLFL